MKYAKSSNQLCCSTENSSVLLLLMSKRCIALASGLAGPVFTGPVFDVSNSMTAHVRMINNKVHNYQSLVHCIAVKHMHYPNYTISIIQTLRVGPCIQHSLV